MKQRISVITIGVTDRERSRKFYEALGWTPTGDVGGRDPDFFQAGDQIFAIWDRDALAKDSEVIDSGGWGGITLSYCVTSPAQVDELTEAARAAGATIAREPGETFWGGYDSIVLDPDGHAWEIAHTPGWKVTDDGRVSLS